MGVGETVVKTYAEDIYASRPYNGSNANSWYENGVGLANQVENRLVWVKSRSHATKHWWFDTVRGANSGLSSGNNDAVTTTAADVWANNNFQTNGFVTGYGNDTGASGREYASWTFGTAPGFFDIVSYTGDGSASRQISHSLGSVPGMIIIKDLTQNHDWKVYHRSLNGGENPAQKNLTLNSQATEDWGSNIFANTDPTASVFSVGDNSYVNNNGNNYIAYLFAGGPSLDATAKSVEFNGTNQALSLASSSDFAYGTGDFTVEMWVKPNDATPGYFCDHGSDNFSFGMQSNYFFYYNGSAGFQTPIEAKYLVGKWNHVAACRSSGTTRMFLNGSQVSSFSDTNNFSSQIFTIGAYGPQNTNTFFNGKISNVRVVKGQALYTTSFTPSISPLTTTSQGATASNVKLLCCNNASTTGSTVTPGTITAHNSPPVRADVPFDDVAASKFGASGSEQMIKAGSYIGNGDDNEDIDIHLGWEPQFLLVKQTTVSTGNWQLIDTATTWPVQGYWETIRPNRNDMAAVDNTDTGIELTPHGFKVVKNWGNFNTDGETHIYLAIRRADAYVGKPITLGSDVFSVTGGQGSGVEPTYSSRGSTSAAKSIFPVDFAFEKDKLYTGNWQIGSRLGGQRSMVINTNANETTDSNFNWDYKLGWNSGGHASERTSWMWRRHEGIDVVYYTGRSPESLQEIPHGLNQVPEMMWLKRRGNSNSRIVYHIGLNGGTNPEDYYIVMGGQDPEASGTYYDAPTSTHFKVTNGSVNGNGDTYQAILFASVTGVSKVTYWAGDDSGSRAISFGFQPRFVIIRIITDNGYWGVWDSHRGFTKRLRMDGTWAEDTQNWFTAGTDGITLTSASDVNASGENYICYAHA